VQFGAVRSLTLLGLGLGSEGLTVLGMSASQASCRGCPGGPRVEDVQRSRVQAAGLGRLICGLGTWAKGPPAQL
jgi:hypothetical protein